MKRKVVLLLAFMMLFSTSLVFAHAYELTEPLSLNDTTMSTVLYPAQPYIPGSTDLALSRAAGNPHGPSPNAPVQNGRHISTIHDGEVWYDVNSFNTWGAVGFGHYTQRLFITYSWDQLHTFTGASVMFGIFTDTGVQWPRNAFIEYSTCIVDYTTGNLRDIHDRLAAAEWHRVGAIGVEFTGNDNRTLAADRGGAPQDMIWRFNEAYNVAVFNQPIQARHVRISIERATDNAVTVNNPGVGIHDFRVFGFLDGFVSDVEWFKSVYGNLLNLRDDVLFPATAPNGTTLTFVSSNPAVLSNTGVVNRPAIGQPNASGTLTITATLAGRTETFVIPWSVDASKSGAEVVAADLARIELEVGRGMLDIALPTVGEEGSIFTWTAHGSPYLSDTGVLNRPAVGAADAQVLVTVTAQYGEATATRDIIITVAALLPAPHMLEARLLQNNMIEVHWSVPHGVTDMAGNQPITGYGFFNAGHRHPDNLTGAGGSFSFWHTTGGHTVGQNGSHRFNFEVQLDGVPLTLPNSAVHYWNLVDYRLRGVISNQHITTLRPTAFDTETMARLESGQSQLTVRVLPDRIRSLSGQYVQEQIISVDWRPYYTNEVRSPNTNILIRGSEFVSMYTLVEAARQMDVFLSAMPKAVTEDLSNVFTMNFFGPSEHTYNIPQHRNPDANWTRAEGLGGNNASAGAANVWRLQYNPEAQEMLPYPAGYRTLYAVDHIYLHELFHGVHNAFNRVFGTAHPLRQEVEEAYRQVRSVANGGRNGWPAYVINPGGPSEYWATLPTVWFNANRDFTRCDFYILDRKGYDFFAKLLPHDLPILGDVWVIEEHRLARPWGGLTADATPFDSYQLVKRPIISVEEFDAITIPFGTALDNINLPEWANVYFTHFASADGTVLPGDGAGFTGLPVTWDISEFNPNVPGTYTILGTIGRVNPTDVFPNPQNLTAEIEVVIAPPTLSLNIFNNGNSNNASLAQAGVIRMWTQLNGVNALVPYAGLEITAQLPNGDCAMEFVSINRIWNNLDYVNMIDVSKRPATWERIYFTATVFGQTVEVILINDEFISHPVFTLDIFNNGYGGTPSRPNASLAHGGTIRMWTQLDGVNAPVPYAQLEVTAELPNGQCAMQFININNMWANPGNVNLIDARMRPAIWERIYLTATLFGQTVEVILVNPEYVSQVLGLSAFNNGNSGNPSLAQLGVVRIWTQLDGINALIPYADTTVTATLLNGECAMAFVRINRPWNNQAYINMFDVSKTPAWQYINFTVELNGRVVELLLINDLYVTTPVEDAEADDEVDIYDIYDEADIDEEVIEEEIE